MFDYTLLFQTTKTITTKDGTFSIGFLYKILYISWNDHHDSNQRFKTSKGTSEVINSIVHLWITRPNRSARVHQEKSGVKSNN